MDMKQALVNELDEKTGGRGEDIVNNFTSIVFTTIGNTVAIRLADKNEYWDKNQKFTAMTNILGARRRNIGNRGERVAWYQTRIPISTESLLDLVF